MEKPVTAPKREPNPEPIPPNINEFLARIPREKADVGLAVDGDADRAGLGDEHGTFVTTLTLYALLMWYLIEVRGLKQPVVKTVPPLLTTN